MRRQSSRLLRDTHPDIPRYTEIHNTWRDVATALRYGQEWQRGEMAMEQGDLINLLENLLGPAAAGVAAPHQASAYYDEAPESYLDADEVQGMSGVLHPSMTGLLSATMPIGILIVETTSLSVVRVNKMLLRMLGVEEPVESMMGR